MQEGVTFELGFKNEKDFIKEAISSKSRKEFWAEVKTSWTHEDAEYVEEQQVANHSNYCRCSNILAWRIPWTV